MYRALTERKGSYRGRSWQLRDSRVKKSAEVIVLCSNELTENVNKKVGGLTSKGRTERKMVFNLEWNLKDSHPKRKQVKTKVNRV